MEVKSYETKVGSVRKYTFEFARTGITLDDDGNEIETRLAEYEDQEVGEPLTLKKRKRDTGIEEHLGQNDPAQNLPRNLTSEIPKSSARSPSEHLHQLAKDQMRQFPDMDYSTAVHRVIEQNPRIVRLYASESNGKVRVHIYPDVMGQHGDPSKHIAQMARELMDDKPKEYKNYVQAVNRVLSDHPALAARYAKWQSNPAHRQPLPAKVTATSQVQARQIVKEHHARVAREGCAHD